MSTDKDWNWLRAKGFILNYLVMEPRGDNTFEAVVKDGYPPKVARMYLPMALAHQIYRSRPTDPTDPMRRRTFSCGTQSTIIGTNILGGLTTHWCRLSARKRIPVFSISLCSFVRFTYCSPVPIELAIRGNSPYVAEGACLNCLLRALYLCPACSDRVRCWQAPNRVSYPPIGPCEGPFSCRDHGEDLARCRAGKRRGSHPFPYPPRDDRDFAVGPRVFYSRRIIYFATAMVRRSPLLPR